MHTVNSPNHESAVGLSIPTHAASQRYTDFTILCSRNPEQLPPHLWRPFCRVPLASPVDGSPWDCRPTGSGTRNAGEARPLGALFIGRPRVLWGRFWAFVDTARWVLGSRS